MTQNPECADCDGPDQNQSQARLHQNAEANRRIKPELGRQCRTER